jgi:hypothetical protein
MSSACRHCAWNSNVSQELEFAQLTYMCALEFGSIEEIEKRIRAIESSGVISGVSTWCEKCRKCSVLSYASYVHSMQTSSSGNRDDRDVTTTIMCRSVNLVFTPRCDTPLTHTHTHWRRADYYARMCKMADLLSTTNAKP